MSNLAINDSSMLSGDHGVTFKIKRSLKEIAESFVYIGFLLWEVKEYKYYLSDGFKSVVDYAQHELGFSKQTTYNFINVCQKFSVPNKEGNPSMRLSMQYENFSYSQLTEMLSLAPEAQKKISSDMTVKQIREFKKEEKIQTSGLDDKHNFKGLIKSLKKVDAVDDPFKKIQIMIDENILIPPAEQEPELHTEQENAIDVEYEVKSDSLIEKNELFDELCYWQREYETMEQRVKQLENEKSTLYELLNQIDKNFKTLTKVQIRNSISDFISTGEIFFNEQ